MMMILEYDRRNNRDRRELDVGASRDLDERRWVPERRTSIVEETEFDDVIEVLPVGGSWHNPAAQIPRGPGETGRRKDSTH
ncbi:hypothetical protein [Azonexus sp.]|jgi:hypothetical protein|uniref:hypothetical protein n=1 Tax=Azonexus sp. TaxID=1872668 RepID=UPI0028229458|nr:hypothetical protein [Azonexus sp.]MDR1995287.1 hypothetical protein [Azonexus sp.]